jgi:hypothetical protein
MNLFQLRNTLTIAEGQGLGALCSGRVEGSQARLPSHRAENKPSASAVMAGAFDSSHMRQPRLSPSCVPAAIAATLHGVSSRKLAGSVWTPTRLFHSSVDRAFVVL